MVGVPRFPRLARDCMRWNLFASMASAAASLRSTCDSERSALECSRQRCPGGTPHVGQPTEDNCVGVRSFILTGAACHKSCGKAGPFGTISVNRITGSGTRAQAVRYCKYILGRPLRILMKRRGIHTDWLPLRIVGGQHRSLPHREVLVLSVHLRNLQYQGGIELSFF